MDIVPPTSPTRDVDRSPQRGEHGLLGGRRPRSARRARETLERRPGDPIERRRVERPDEEREHPPPFPLTVRYRRAGSSDPGGPLADVVGPPEAIRPPLLYDALGRTRPLAHPSVGLDLTL